jgi:hypothetical protein
MPHLTGSEIATDLVQQFTHAATVSRLVPLARTAIHRVRQELDDEDEDPEELDEFEELDELEEADELESFFFSPFEESPLEELLELLLLPASVFLSPERESVR